MATNEIGNGCGLSTEAVLASNHKRRRVKSTFGWALSNLVALLRWNLFSYRNLWEWINRPFDTPPESPGIQGELFDLDSILPNKT